MVAYYCVFVAYIAIFERTSSGPETLSAAEAPSDSTAAPLLDEATLSLGGNGADTEPGDAASADGSGGRGAGDAKPSLLAVLQTPLRWLARLTMPEVATAGASRYPRASAVLLPVTAPLFVVLVKRLALSGGSPLNGDALLYGAVCSGFASMLTAALYPADGRHRGVLTGFFTVMAFCMSVLWMNILSAEMVRAWKVRTPLRQSRGPPPCKNDRNSFARAGYLPRHSAHSTQHTAHKSRPGFTTALRLHTHTSSVMHTARTARVACRCSATSTRRRSACSG